MTTSNTLRVPVYVYLWNMVFLTSTLCAQLYDLMVMALKHQVLMCPQPADLLLVTLNHLDALRAYATSPTVSEQVESTVSLFIQVSDGFFC